MPAAFINSRKHGNDDPRSATVSNVFGLRANRKLRHRELLLERFAAIISAPAEWCCPTMRLPEFRTMVVALMSHPALGTEPLCTWRANRTSGTELAALVRVGPICRWNESDAHLLQRLDSRGHSTSVP